MLEYFVFKSLKNTSADKMHILLLHSTESGGRELLIHKRLCSVLHARDVFLFSLTDKTSNSIQILLNTKLVHFL